MSSTLPTAANPNPADTLTLADLVQWNRRDAAGNFLPSLAVLGHPVAHSVSPQMHNAALAALANKHPPFTGWKYFKFDITPEQFSAAASLLFEKSFLGVNLTVPHKIAAVGLVGGNKEAESVNTLWRTSGGWHGTTTDPYGLTEALRRELAADLRGAAVILLGAGGAAVSAANACLDAGCKTLWIGNRSKEKLHGLLKAVAGRVGAANVQGFDLAEPPADKWPPNVVVINATTLGLKRDDPVPFDVKLLGKEARVFDMIYNREGATKLVSAARAQGLRATDGLGMLVWQGAKSLSIWVQAETGIAIKPEDIAPTMMEAACSALGLPPRHA